MILDEIIASRRISVAALKEVTSIRQLEKQIAATNLVHYSFKQALKAQRQVPHIIAEVKRASPSKGMICQDFKPIDIAREYREGGATALSVLTEPKYFLGDNAYLTAIKEQIPIPILRKDFIIDPIQIYEAKAIGADAILLIVAALSRGELMEYLKLAHSLDLDVLVEAHDEVETYMALDVDADIIGVNNRNLKNFEVSLETSKRLRKLVPKEKVFVSESGIKTEADMRLMKALEVDAVLIGEGIVTSANKVKKLEILIDACIK